MAFKSPVSFPFIVLKRASEVKKQITHDFFDQHNRECMPLWQINIVVIFILIRIVYPSPLTMGAERQQIAFIVEILYELPELTILNKMLNIFILDIVRDTRASSKIQQCLMNIATSKQLVVAMKFCIRFLQQHYPKLVSVALGEERLSIWIAGDVIVNSYCHPFSIFAKSYFIQSG